MSERQRQANFLKLLIRNEDNEHRRNLQDRIRNAEQDEKCIRRMLFLVITVELFSLAGLGYSAVFHPNFFANTTPFLVRLFTAMGLGSLVCMVAFVGYWGWHRRVLNGLNEECRRTVIATLQSPVRTPPTTASASPQTTIASTTTVSAEPTTKV